MNIDVSNIFGFRIPQPEPASGDILIAAPLLSDGCFQRAVVCLIDHDTSSGSMGIITNRLSDYMLNELVGDIRTEFEIPVFIGGPVHKERLYYLHTLGNLIPDSVEVVSGLYVGGDYDAVKHYINSGGEVEGKIRFFLGYSGWEGSQLRKELNQFDWAVGHITSLPIILCDEGNEAWSNAVAQLGEPYAMWTKLPIDVTMN